MQITDNAGHLVSDEELASSAEVEQVRSKLAEAVKACRSMVANYRAMLDTDANDNVPEAPAEPADPM
jgi:hypothetical protein